MVLKFHVKIYIFTGVVVEGGRGVISRHAKMRVLLSYLYIVSTMHDEWKIDSETKICEGK